MHHHQTIKQMSTNYSRPAALTLVIMTAFGLSAAHAELVIQNEPTYQLSKVDSKAVIAQTPSEASIIKLMQVLHIDEQIDAIVNGQNTAIEAINKPRQTGEQPADDDELSERQREIRDQIQGLLGQYAKIMTGTIDSATDREKMTQAYITAAKTYYSQAEVDAQIDFYDTPIGQSILAKQPQVTAAFLKQSLPTDMSDTEEQLGELLPQVKKIIQGIF